MSFWFCMRFERRWKTAKRDAAKRDAKKCTCNSKRYLSWVSYLNWFFTLHQLSSFLAIMPTWTPADWDKPGYNPKNGKVRALFRWEGCQPGNVFHPTSGQIVPGLSFARPHARAFRKSPRTNFARAMALFEPSTRKQSNDFCVWNTQILRGSTSSFAL